MHVPLVCLWRRAAPPARRPRDHRLPLAALLVRAVLLCCVAVPAAVRAVEDSARIRFALPAEAAEVALKKFSEQSGRQVVFPTEVARGVRTSAVNGEFTAREALSQMLAGTPLRAVLNERTGAWAILREESSGPNGARAAPAGDRPIPSAEASSPAGGDKIELSPFVVNEDNNSGWLATSTLAGSRMNTPLRDTGASIAVMTSEFLQDIGAVTLEDAVGYAVNIHMSGSEGPSPDQNPAMFNFENSQVRVRGVAATVTRNYFRWELPGDTYNLDRIEENRGPNSILFGIGSAGGVVNSLTKRANLSRDFRRGTVMAGSYDSYRATLDVNQRALNGKLGLRANAVVSNFGSYRHHSFNDTRRIHLAGTWQALRNTQLRVDYEIGEVESVGTRAAPAYDGVTSWFAAGAPTIAAVQTANLGQLGLTRYATNAARVTFVENSGAVFDYRGQNRATGDNLVILDRSLVDYSVNAVGPYNRRDANLQALSVFLEHRFGRNTFAELSHNLQMSNRDTWVNGQGRAENATLYADPHRFLPNGQPNPFAGGLMFEGGRWTTSITRIKTHNTRLMLSHERDFGRWGDYRMAVMGEHEWRKQIDRNWVEVWAGAPFNSTPENDANHVWRRYYVTPGDWASYNAGPGPRNGLLQNVPDPTTPGRVLNSTWVPFNQNGQREPVEHQNTVLLGGHARYFSGRLVVGFGFRRDELDLRANQAVRDPVSNIWTVDHPSVVREHESYSGDTKTLGVVGHATRHISLFYNTSNSINVPNAQHRILPDGRTPPNSEASGEDFGVRLTFFDGKLSARLNRYTVDLVGATGAGFGGTVDNPTVLNDRVLSALVAAGRITPAERDARDFTTNQATIDRKLEGYEFNMTGAVTRNWSVSLNYSYSDGYDANVGPEVKAWMAEALPWYRQHADVLTSVAGTNGQLMTVGELVTMWENDVQRLHFAREGDLILGNRKHKFNVFTRYSFSGGPLKGLTVGGGYRYQSKAATQIGNNDVLLYSKDQGDTDAFISYRLRVPRFFKSPVNLQLNVRNVLDETDPRITTWTPDGLKPRSVVVVEPRSWRLTASFDF